MDAHAEGTRVTHLAPPGARHAAGIPPKPWGLPAVIGVLSVPVLFWVLGFFVNAPDEQSRGEIVANLIALVILSNLVLFIGLPAAFALWRYKLGWQGLGFRLFERRLWWLPVAIAGASLAGVIVYGIILEVIGAGAPEQEDIETLFDDNAVLPLVFIALVIMAPLSEEVFFRAFVFPGLVRPIGLVPAMVVSGLIFGMFHVTGLSSLGLVLPFGAIGAMFAWLYYRTGSIWSSIIAHALFNSVGFTANALS
jgi:membrane protease YdiL (CAAX protease family)